MSWAKLPQPALLFFRFMQKILKPTWTICCSGETFELCTFYFQNCKSKWHLITFLRQETASNVNSGYLNLSRVRVWLSHQKNSTQRFRSTTWGYCVIGTGSKILLEIQINNFEMKPMHILCNGKVSLSRNVVMNSRHCACVNSSTYKHKNENIKTFKYW